MPHDKRSSLRARMITLVLIPSAALLALWAVLTAVLATDIRDLRATATLTEEVGAPVVDVISHLQRERRATMAAPGSTTSGTPLPQAQEETDQAVTALTRAVDSLDHHDLPAQVLDFQTALERLDHHRATAADPPADTSPLQAVAAPYSHMIETGLRVWDAQVERADPAVTPHLRSLTSLMRARELLNQQDMILAHAVATDSFTPQAHAQFAAAVGAQQHTWSRVDAELGEDRGDDYRALEGSFQMKTVQLLQESVIGSPVHGPAARVPINAPSWRGAAEALDARMLEVEQGRRERVVDLGHGQARDLLGGVLLVSVPALVVALASALVAVAGSQRLGRRLQQLRTDSLHHARFRLPQVTARLRAGDSVDVNAEAPRLPVVRRDELGQVAEAFNDAQRAAVVAAVEEAQVRAGVRNMFRNIARRTQSLVHRQLALLDRLERSETDPKVLESLFRIDHFSTQMRRNAENLMLLSGDQPTRSGAVPVGLHEAVRAAASEIEDYSRVRVLTLPRVRLSGRAGADLVRLIAELLENSASFSPPGTEVTVGGRPLEGGGHLVEVEDRGLGMTAGRLESANALLAHPPRFDLARIREDSQLGLFVVATVAARHGFEVELRALPYQGTRAQVRIPASAVAEHSPGAGPVRPLGAQAPRETAALAPAPVGADPPGQGPDGPAPSPAAPGQTYKGLPLRRRNRADPAVPGAVRPRGAHEHPGTESTGGQRSLSQIRSMMSAFQAGTERGRAEPAEGEDEGGVLDQEAPRDESSEG
ncbi:ATPase [Nocardiopsis terrae]|uniref:histidine kinase n=1 Tax=Nocardiopsis terrae TaxID=372655 RepID=A0ABR9HHJ8_9ACTN|nr:nitrate- and nitrite sensing domain-containing protein [Nocardiopsis terrae]MBE1458494.1 signal transduction histidine kinase [Nocardiopsis terrae]GHC80106.1 ATPase [Nocardiopsis terrae]